MEDLPAEVVSPPPDPSAGLGSARGKLRALAVVVALAWFFSPVGGLRMLIGLVDAAARGPLQTDPQQILAGAAGLTLIGIVMFPSGLIGYLPGLTQLLADSTVIVVGGWLAYAGLVAAIFLINRRRLVRAIFIVFVLLVTWNTAGCYPVFQQLH